MDVSHETKSRFLTYKKLLHQWQQKINLIGPATLHHAEERHINDSLQLLEYIPFGTKTLYDLGSGAGFPGLVIAIGRPEINVTLIESDSKKCAFLATVSRETRVKVNILNMRIESSGLPAPDFVTARALAPLPVLLSYCQPWAKENPNLTCLFLKGAGYEAEVAQAKADWEFDMEEKVNKTDPAARVLSIKKIRQMN